MRHKRFALIAAMLILAACGRKQELVQDPPGEPPPPKPIGATDQPTPSQLMTPDNSARPQRSDEILKQSEKRKDDPFDLPPS